MLIRDIPIKKSAVGGRYKWKLSEADKDFMGSFELRDLGSRIEIWCFGIYKEHRGRGYGQRMLREAIEVAKNKEIRLYVYRDNDIAIHVYEKCGFKITGQFGEEAWRMTYTGNDVGCAEADKAALCA